MSALTTAARVLRVLTVVLGALLTAGLLYVVVARLLFPIEAEWMTGAMHDGIARVRDGRPLYAPPSVEFVPFLYPPLYTYVAAALAVVLPVPLAAKVVSLASTCALGGGIWRLARAHGATRWWAAAAVLLHVGAYSLTLFFYDLARVDAFAAALVVLGLVTLGGEARDLRTALGGSLLGLAFFAKQPGLLALGAAVVGLASVGEKRRAAIVAAAGAFVLVAGCAVLHVTTKGWFWFYCWKLPAAHGLDARYVSSFFVVDAPRAFLLFGASVAVVVLALRAPRDRLLGCVLAAAMTSAFVLRGHRGGFANVLLVWTPLACVAVAVVASRVASSLADDGRGRAIAEVVLLAATMLQLGAWTYDPHDVAPQASDVTRAATFRAYVRALEQDGEVWVATSGGHLHAAALFDLTDADEPAPPDLVRAVEERRFAAILFRNDDEPSCATPSCSALRDAIARRYFAAAHFLYSARRTDGKVGYDGRPRWLLRPRRSPLPFAPPNVRQRERALAAANAWEAGEDQLAAPDDTIEVRATARTF